MSYGNSIVHGDNHQAQALPRLLTLFYELGSDLVREKASERKQQMKMTLYRLIQCLNEFEKSIPMIHWVSSLSQLISRVCHGDQEVSAKTKDLIIAVANSYP